MTEYDKKFWDELEDSLITKSVPDKIDEVLNDERNQTKRGKKKQPSKTRASGSGTRDGRK